MSKTDLKPSSLDEESSARAVVLGLEALEAPGQATQITKRRKEFILIAFVFALILMVVSAVGLWVLQGASVPSATQGSEQTEEQSQSSQTEESQSSHVDMGGASSESTSEAPTSKAQRSQADQGTAQGLAPEVTQDSSAPNAPVEPKLQRIQVRVSSGAVGNPVHVSATLDVASAQTPYAALQATGLKLNTRNSQFGVYVAAVGGLAEKEHGPSSGWMYSVNGQVPQVAASAYRLHAGDVVEWYYVV